MHGGLQPYPPGSDVTGGRIVGSSSSRSNAGLHSGSRGRAAGIVWPPAHLLITTSTTGMPWGLVGTDTEWFQLSVYEISTHKLHTYPEPTSDLRIVNVIVGSPMIRHIGNDTVLFLTGLWVDDRTKLALFKVNLTTHRQAVVRQGGDATLGWLVDEAGEIVAEDNYYEHDQRWQMKLRHNGRWFEAST
jgi:hypothetical protein